MTEDKMVGWHSSKCGLSPREQLERQVKLHSFTQDEALPSWPNSSGTLRWERLKAGGEGMTEDEMVGWHHRLEKSWGRLDTGI